MTDIIFIVLSFLYVVLCICAVKSRLKYYLKHRSIPLNSSPRKISIDTVFKMAVAWLFKLAFKLKSIAQKYKIIEAVKNLEKKTLKYRVYVFTFMMYFDCRIVVFFTYEVYSIGCEYFVF